MLFFFYTKYTAQETFNSGDTSSDFADNSNRKTNYLLKPQIFCFVLHNFIINQLFCSYRDTEYPYSILISFVYLSYNLGGSKNWFFPSP